MVSIILSRLSIDSLLRASDGGRGEDLPKGRRRGTISVAAAPANFRLEPEPEPATMRAEPSHRVEAATLAEPSRASFGHAKPAEPA